MPEGGTAMEPRLSGIRQIAITDAGSDLFMRIRQGNGSFATATSGNAPAF